MEKPGKWIFTVVLILVVAALLAQVIGLLGKQSLGWNMTYIQIYLLLLSASLIFLAVFGIFIEAARYVSDHPLLDIISIFDFDESQEFRLFNGDPKAIALGLVAGILFFSVITGTVWFLNIGKTGDDVFSWQGLPAPVNIEEAYRSPMAEGHQEKLDQLGIDKGEEAWYISAQPSVGEDIVFNFFIPSILVALIYVPLFIFGIEPDKGNFIIVSLIAVLITSGMAGAWTSGLVPTFSGSHSDAYTNIPSFYAAAGYSFMASFINLQVGYPISIPAHFSNNLLVSLGLMVTLAIGTGTLKFNIVSFLFQKYKTKGENHAKNNS